MAVTMSFVSCEKNRSYAELLKDERQACNAFLCNFRLAEVPADSVFEVGSDAPFYKLDAEGNVYMQVLKAGDRKNNKARTSATLATISTHGTLRTEPGLHRVAMPTI